MDFTRRFHGFRKWRDVTGLENTLDLTYWPLMERSAKKNATKPLKPVWEDGSQLGPTRVNPFYPLWKSRSAQNWEIIKSSIVEKPPPFQWPRGRLEQSPAQIPWGPGDHHGTTMGPPWGFLELGVQLLMSQRQRYLTSLKSHSNSSSNACRSAQR